MAIFYTPPADIADFAESATQAAALKQHWHDYIAGRFGQLDGGLFYDASNDPIPGTPVARKAITWNGFPQSIWRWFNADADPAGPAQAVAAAETLRPFTLLITSNGLATQKWTPNVPPLRRVENGQLGDPVVPFHRQQDEYCEWHVDRNPDGSIRRIAFTAEGPEYWEKMAEKDLDLVELLYRRHVDPTIVKADLVWPHDVAAFNVATQTYTNLVFGKGDYNPYNRWNTRFGAMHLTHPANTLGAEIRLAHDGTVLRPGVPPLPAATLPDRLICCAGYGGVNRSSDPRIGADVNALARSGLAVTLANPVGLYISAVEIGGLKDPNGIAIPQALKLTRVSADGKLVLRAEIAPPVGASYALSECKFDGVTVTGGGQFARKITMTLIGEAKQIPGRTPVSVACENMCCTHPSKPAFKAGVDLGPPDPCAGLSAADWASMGPSVPGDALPSASLGPVSLAVESYAGGQKLPRPDKRSLR